MRRCGGTCPATSIFKIHGPWRSSARPAGHQPLERAADAGRLPLPARVVGMSTLAVVVGAGAAHRPPERELLGSDGAGRCFSDYGVPGLVQLVQAGI